MALSIVPSKLIKSKSSASDLNELCKKQHLKGPEYKLINTEGPSHLRIFTVQVLIENLVFSEAKEKTIKKAKQSAAYNALIEVRKQFEDRIFKSFGKLDITDGKTFDCNDKTKEKYNLFKIESSINKKDKHCLNINEINYESLTNECKKNEFDLLERFFELLDMNYLFSLTLLLKTYSINTNYVDILKIISEQLKCDVEYILKSNSKNFICLLIFQKLNSKYNPVKIFVTCGDSNVNLDEAIQFAARKAIIIIKSLSENCF